MNKKYKIIFAFSALLCICLSLGGTLSHAMPSNECHSWYFKKQDNGQRPPEPSELSFINNYSCKWIDRNDRHGKVIYLTFDVGYENGNVGKILDAMKKEGVTGTFFILENVIKKDPELIKRMAAEGHTIGNHTAKHPDMSKISDKTIFMSQLTKLEDCARENLGIEISKYFRPPEGRFSEQTLDYLEQFGYKTVFWSFAYADWDNKKQPDPQKAIDNIISHTHDGMVILLHPTSATNAAIMPELLKRWKEMGYRFGTADELFGN